MAKAPSDGAYLSLGTDRGLFALGLAGYRFKQVILADHDPAVIYFNEINLALIATAKTMQDYRSLRFARNSLEFQLHLKKQQYTPKGILDLRAVMHGRWFTKRMMLFQEEFLDACKQGSLGPIYFQNEDHYNSLRSMVLEGRVVTRFLELNQARPYKKIELELDKEDLKISVLDLSNAWWERYMHKKDRTFMLGPKQFHRDGIVMVTDKDLDQDISEDRSLALNWNYYGFLRSQLLELFEDGIKPKSLEHLFSYEGCLLPFFPGQENSLIDLSEWQAEFDESLYLDRPGPKPVPASSGLSK